jgi:thiamine phosphate synthase YjbQ (UPF0047 family)
MDITSLVSDFVANAEVYSGQVTIFSKHTTVAVVVNEMESRLMQDLRTYLGKLAPSGDGYLHNDLDKRLPPPGTGGIIHKAQSSCRREFALLQACRA